jgi:hypothetical protein
MWRFKVWKILALVGRIFCVGSIGRNWVGSTWRRKRIRSPNRHVLNERQDDEQCPELWWLYSYTIVTNIQSLYSKIWCLDLQHLVFRAVNIFWDAYTEFCELITWGCASVLLYSSLCMRRENLSRRLTRGLVELVATKVVIVKRNSFISLIGK